MQKHTLRLLWRTAWSYPVRTTLIIILPITSVLSAAFLGPYIISQLLNTIQSGTLTLAGAMPLIIAYAIASIYGEVIGFRVTLFCHWTMETAGQRDLLSRMMSHLTSQSQHFHSNRFGGSLVSQTGKLFGAFEKFWDTIVFQFIPMITSVVAATIILSFVFWQYAIFLFVLSLIFAITAWRGSEFLAERNKREAQAQTAVTGRGADIITNITAVTSFGHEGDELQAYNTKTKEWRDRSLSSMRGFLGVSTIYSLLISLLNIVALIAAVWAVEHGNIAIGTVYLCLAYTLTVAHQLWQMNQIMRNFYRLVGDASDMVEILNTVPDILDPKKPEQIAIDKGAINFRNVEFSHNDDQDDEILFEDFSLDVASGQKVGLVGHSGSGKTTLIRLLLRFMDITKGSITIDGQDIRSVRQADLRKSIAYVPQEPLLFHRSLRENIAYGKPNATDEEITEAARKAHALEFIDKLPDKFETLVGERGVKLSGGQRQRIAIGRAILKDAPILVLDEATSALDSESEKLIQAALWELMKDRTAIVIAHRLSTIQRMDRIVVLEDGRIAEQGSHKELLEKDGIYAGLWAHQSGGFIEE